MLRFTKGSEKVWRRGGNQLASVLNYALIRPVMTRGNTLSVIIVSYITLYSIQIFFETTSWLTRVHGNGGVISREYSTGQDRSFCSGKVCLFCRRATARSNPCGVGFSSSNIVAHLRMKLWRGPGIEILAPKQIIPIAPLNKPLLCSYCVQATF